MRCVICLIGLALLVGCSRDRYSPMGDAAPAFGSTAGLSTLQGFAVGTWRESYDATAEGNGPHFLRASLALDTPVITLTADGRVTLQTVKHRECTANGSWAVQGDRLVFVFTDVDGLSFEQIDTQLEDRQAENRQIRHVLSPLSRHSVYIPEGIALTRSVLASACYKFPNLVVGADRKRLEEVIDAGPDANPNIEKSIWLRVK